jgi:hypothetical protein
MDVQNRKVVSMALAGLAAVGAAFLVLHASPAGSTSRTTASGPSCSAKKFGMAVTNISFLRINGHQRYSAPLHAGDRLLTSPIGQATVCLKLKTSTCTLLGASKARVNPKKGVAFRLNAGEVQCDTKSGTERDWTSPTAKITVGDPSFAIVVRKGQTTVKVLHGLVEVTGQSGSGAVVAVSANQQSTVLAQGDPAAPGLLQLTPNEQAVFKKLAAAQPPPFLARPAIAGSDVLRSIFDRHALVAAYDKELAPDEQAAQFARSFLAFLAHSWGLKLSFQVTSATVAAGAIAADTTDLFVTTDPAAVEFVGRRLETRFGITALPFFADSNGDMVSIASRVDAGLTTAARRFITTSALQTDDYRHLYQTSFKRDPAFNGSARDIVFPPTTYAKGPATLVHKQFKAVRDGKIAPGLTIAERLIGSCDSSSPASLRTDAWHCVDASGRDWDPCFSGVRLHVLCPENPAAIKPTNVADLSLTAPLPKPSNLGGDLTRGRARLVKTSDGLCQPLFGSKIVYGSKPADYACRAANGSTIDRYLLDEPYRGSNPWAIVAVPGAVAFRKSVVADAVNVPEIWWW